MKKIAFTLVLCFGILSATAQEATTQEVLKKNELKINMSNLIGFKWVDISYEKVLNEESSIGVSTLISLDSGVYGFGEYKKFSITPYYRHFFSSKYGEGFFVEVFTMLHSGSEEVYYYEDFPYSESGYTENDYTDFAAGISVGGKFVTKRGFLAEVYLGIGRDLLGQSENEIVGRGGISIGYRF